MIPLGDILYGRRYRVLVGVGDNKALDVSQLRCTFRVEKSMSEEPNLSEVTIYNLSAETENTIIVGGNDIVVEAGYEGEQYGMIFKGNVVQPLRNKEDGVTYSLQLISQDGDKFLNGGIISASFRKGQTQRNIANELTNKASNPVQTGAISSDLDNVKLARGKVVFGLSKDYLRQISKSQDAVFYVNDGVVNIVKATDLPPGEIFSLGPDSGLIGAPEQTENGIKGKCLLNPRINLNSLIHIDNSIIRMQKIQAGQTARQLNSDGVYRVIKLVHSGDTRGDDWYTEFEAVAQAGSVPQTGKSMR